MTGHQPTLAELSQSKLGSLINHSARLPSSFMPKVQNIATRLASSRATRGASVGRTMPRRLRLLLRRFFLTPLLPLRRRLNSFIKTTINHRVDGFSRHRAGRKKNSAQVLDRRDVFFTRRCSSRVHVAKEIIDQPFETRFIW